MKLQLKKEVISSLTSEVAGKVKGGTATDLTSAISSVYASCACMDVSDKKPPIILTDGGINSK